MESFSGPVEIFLNFLREVEEQCRMAEADELEMNDITNDIHHDMELVEHTRDEVTELALELIETRRKRRRAKDIQDTAAPLLDYINKHRKELKDLEQTLGAIRRSERKTEGRIYTPRAKR